MKFLFNIQNKTYCNLRLRWNTQDAKFPKHLFPGTEIFVPNMTYEADYPSPGEIKIKKDSRLFFQVHTYLSRHRNESSWEEHCPIFQNMSEYEIGEKSINQENLTVCWHSDVS